jgi:hypothetical protein
LITYTGGQNYEFTFVGFFPNLQWIERQG